MKLYYSPGACSLASHIIMNEVDLPFEIEKVDLRSKITATGRNFLEVTPKGQVPTLVLDDGTVLTEGPAILQYLADSSGNNQLLAPVGDIARYKTISALNFVGTELHSNFGPLFHGASEEEKTIAINKLKTKFDYVNKILSEQEYFSGNTFTIADAYLFVAFSWSKIIPNLPDYPAINKYMAKIAVRPAVKKAIQAES